MGHSRSGSPCFPANTLASGQKGDHPTRSLFLNLYNSSGTPDLMELISIIVEKSTEF